MTGRKQENFIFGQALPSYAEMPYGRSTIGKAGCEAIACYNVMVLLGRPMPFSEVKAYFEGLFKRGMGWMAGGMLGATPIEIRTHSSDPVPFMIYRSGRDCGNGADSYDEDSAAKTGLFIGSGAELTEMFLSEE